MVARSPGPSIEAGDRDRLVRRSTALLVGAQAGLWGALGIFAAFGAIGMAELSGLESGAALFFGLYYLAAAPAAVLAGRAMDRLGRRAGLLVGYLLLIVAGVGAFAAVSLRSVFGLVLSGMAVGVGAGAALLGRAAVADMHHPKDRGRAVGRLVVAGTLGAVGAPLLGGAVHGWAKGQEVIRADAAPWLLVPVFGVIALACVVALSPDPRELAVESAERGSIRHPQEILRLPPALVAALTIGVAQAVMVMFMGVIPSGLHRHGSSELTVTVVVSLHLGGMFAFSPLIGSLLDRWGRRSGLVAAGVLSIAGVLAGALAEGTLVPGAGLFLIGLGWSAAYIGSTAIVSDLSAPAERAAALGMTDLIAGLSAAAGVLGGILLVEATRLSVLGLTAAGLLLVPLGFLAKLREPAPAPAVAAVRTMCP